MYFSFLILDQFSNILNKQKKVYLNLKMIYK